MPQPFARFHLRWIMVLVVGLLMVGQSAAAVDRTSGVNTLEKITIGGIPQWIRIRGQNATNPLLLFLHGGPGFPMMPFAEPLRQLEANFVVVHWDQRGAGKSYTWGMSRQSMRAGKFVADTHQLVLELLKRFHRKRCLLVAHSWGTMFGAIEVSRHPELFQAYVGVGQLANLTDNDQFRYQFAMGEATRARNTEAIQSLQRVGLPPYAGGDGWDVLDKQVRSFARREFQGGVKTSTLGGLALRSRDYSLGDKIKILAGYGFSVSALWSELYKIDLFREAKRIDVPVYLISGRHDRVAAEGAVRHFLDSLEAPAGKRLILFNDSAHWPMFEESDRFCAELIAISRATAQRR